MRPLGIEPRFVLLKRQVPYPLGEKRKNEPSPGSTGPPGAWEEVTRRRTRRAERSESNRPTRVDLTGFEPVTPALPERCSAN